MIILPDQKINIITPPKCGSTSLHEALCRNPKYNAIFFIGPSGNNGKFNRDIDKHTIYAPMEYQNHDYYVVIRNPRDRFISLFHHYRRWHKDNKTFDQYVTMLENNELTWFYHFTIGLIIAELNGINYRFLNLETINEDLAKLGIRTHVPLLHTRNAEPADAGYKVPATWLDYDIPKARPPVGVI
jgi:hypothetical protein